MRDPRRITRPTLLAIAGALALAGAATPAVAGPPWISVELPANPLDAATRGAFLVVRTYHHESAMSYRPVGHAIGMVDGRRQTLDLTFTPAGTTGTWVLRRSWPARGAWVLTLNVGGAEGPTALVAIGEDGQVHSVKVPTRTDGNYERGRAITDRDISAALQSVAALDAPSSGRPGAAALLFALPVAAGVAVVRRRRG